ncbi:MAG: hypothetical protein R3D33_15535 [Hyphomicrobiaceae bacterium]
MRQEASALLLDDHPAADLQSGVLLDDLVDPAGDMRSQRIADIEAFAGDVDNHRLPDGCRVRLRSGQEQHACVVSLSGQSNWNAEAEGDATPRSRRTLAEGAWGVKSPWTSPAMAAARRRAPLTPTAGGIPAGKESKIWPL